MGTYKHRIGLNYRIGPGFLCYGHFFFDILFFMHSWKRFTAYKTIFTSHLHSNIKKTGPNITPPIYIYSQTANVGYARSLAFALGSDDKPAPNSRTMLDRQRYVVTSYRRRPTPDVGPTSIWHSMLTVQILKHEII